MTPEERWEGHVLMPEGLNASQMDESICLSLRKLDTMLS